MKLDIKRVMVMNEDWFLGILANSYNLMSDQWVTVT